LFYEEYKKNGPVYNKFAFPMTMWFLRSRFDREMSLSDPSKTYIIDRGIIEDRTIFAQNYIENGIINNEEAKEYINTFNAYKKEFNNPDVYVYIRASVDTLMHRILERSRGMETGVERSYLEDLQRLYETNMLPKMEESGVDLVVLDTDFMAGRDVVDQVYERILNKMKINA